MVGKMWLDFESFPKTSPNGKPYGTAYLRGVETCIRKNVEAVRLVGEFDKDPIEIGKKLVKLLKVTYHKSTRKSHSKLDGGASLSTAVTCNKFCQARIAKAIAENDWTCICIHCFSEEDMKQFNFLHQAMIRNYYILTNCLIPMEAWRTMKIKDVLFFRIESFGDVENIVQSRNYLRFAWTHAEIERIAAWTKNKAIWKSAIRIEGRPRNLAMVLSSSHIDRVDLLDADDAEYFDHRFTVLDEPENSAKVNCGGRLCRACLRCYKRIEETGAEFDVFEALKQARKSINNR